MVVCKEFGVVSSFTCESSFCGAEAAKFCGTHFAPQTYHVYSPSSANPRQEFGARFCESLLDMLDQNKVAAAVRELEGMFPGRQPVEQEDGSDSADDCEGDETRKHRRRRHKLRPTIEEKARKRSVLRSIIMCGRKMSARRRGKLCFR